MTSLGIRPAEKGQKKGIHSDRSHGFYKNLSFAQYLIQTHQAPIFPIWRHILQLKFSPESMWWKFGLCISGKFKQLFATKRSWSGLRVIHRWHVVHDWAVDSRCFGWKPTRSGLRRVPYIGRLRNRTQTSWSRTKILLQLDKRLPISWRSGNIGLVQLRRI